MQPGNQISSDDMETSERLENVCIGCGHRIVDRYLLCIDGEMWHERCVVCTVCFRPLEHSCHVRDGKLFCKYHYFRHFRVCCLSCGHPIFPQESMLRLDKLTIAQAEVEYERGSLETGQMQCALKIDLDKGESQAVSTSTGCLYFHNGCFTCFKCHRLLCPGEPYVLRGSLPLCYADYQKEMLEYNFQTQDSFPIVFSESELDYANTLATDRLKKTLEHVHSTVESMLDLSKKRDDPDSCEVIPMTADYQSCSRPASSDESSRGITYRPDEEEELFELDSDSGSGKNSKRPRTILTASQRRRFKSVFEMNPKPARKMREALANETGLNIRVVQVWFQNQRAKMKKLARRQAQELLHQTGRRLYSSNARPIENQSTGHIMAQGMNPESAVVSPLRRNGSEPSLYNFSVAELEDHTAVAPPVHLAQSSYMETSALKTAIPGPCMTENSTFPSDPKIRSIKQTVINTEMETIASPEMDTLSDQPQTPLSFAMTSCSNACTSTSTGQGPMLPSTQTMSVRLIPTVPILAGPYCTTPPIPRFESTAQVTTNMSVTDLILSSSVPAMDKLFSMQQSYFFS